MKRFSVIIPTLNSPTIDRTIASIKAQSFPKDQFEIIIVGKDDLGLIQNDEDIQFINTKERLYPGAARNLGVTHAVGEIIAFIDSDCIAMPDWLEILSDRFIDPNISIIGGGVAFDEDNYWTLVDNISMFHESLSSLKPGIRNQLPSLNFAIRRKVFLDVGGYDPNRPIAEDSDLTIRLRQKEYILFFEPKAAVVHKPTRRTATDLIRHHYKHGGYSIKIDPKFSTEKGIPKIFRSRLGILILSPFLAIGVTLRIFLFNFVLLRYLHTAPAILSSKFAWCIGAANREKIILDRA